MNLSESDTRTGDDAGRETFVGEAITPVDLSFTADSMAGGAPGLPARFAWKGRTYSVGQVLEAWKEAGDCRHGSGERYVRKHWYRIRTTEGIEMRIYFERQARSGSRARWRLYSLREVRGGEEEGGPAGEGAGKGTMGGGKGARD